MKKFLSLLLVSILGGAITLGIYKFAFEKQIPLIENQENQSKFVTASYNPSTLEAAENINFTEAADKTVHAVVHVKNLTVSKGPTSIMEYFYGSGSSQPRTQVGTGSGVIISPDGKILKIKKSGIGIIYENINPKISLNLRKVIPSLI